MFMISKIFYIKLPIVLSNIHFVAPGEPVIDISQTGKHYHSNNKKRWNNMIRWNEFKINKSNLYIVITVLWTFVKRNHFGYSSIVLTPKQHDNLETRIVSNQDSSKALNKIMFKTRYYRYTNNNHKHLLSPQTKLERKLYYYLIHRGFIINCARLHYSNKEH